MSEISLNAPFLASTSPTIDRANRLISVRTNPGFLDILRISQEMANEAALICANYPGWDPQQITVLKVRMQVAKEHHEQLLGRINEAIREGIEEARASALPSKTAAEAVETGDYVRQKVLEKFNEMDMRPAGSY